MCLSTLGITNNYKSFKLELKEKEDLNYSER